MVKTHSIERDGSDLRLRFVDGSVESFLSAGSGFWSRSNSAEPVNPPPVTYNGVIVDAEFLQPLGAYWLYGAPSAEPHVAIESISGLNALRIRAAGMTVRMNNGNRFDVEAGQKYEFKFFARNSTNQTLNFAIGRITAEGAVSYAALTTIPANSNTLKQYSASYVIPTGFTRAFFSVSLPSGATTGNAWIQAPFGRLLVPPPPVPEPGGAFRLPFPGPIPGNNYEGHSGIDWNASHGVNAGAPIKAIGAGVVMNTWGWTGNTSDWNSPDWRGCAILIDHGDIAGRSVWSMYCHMQNPPTLTAGTAVNGGQVLGTVGNTGLSFGSHLHFEIILYGQRLSTGQGGYERARDWMSMHAEGSW